MREFEEQYHFAVDIPKVDSRGNPDLEWYCVEYFKTKEEALEFAKVRFGADEEGKVCLISEF